MVNYESKYFNQEEINFINNNYNKINYRQICRDLNKEPNIWSIRVARACKSMSLGRVTNRDVKEDFFLNDNNRIALNRKRLQAFDLIKNNYTKP